MFTMSKMPCVAIPSLKLTWYLKMVVSNRNLLFQRSVFRCYVSFTECSPRKLLDGNLLLYSFVVDFFSLPGLSSLGWRVKENEWHEQFHKRNPFTVRMKLVVHDVHVFVDVTKSLVKIAVSLCVKAASTHAHINALSVATPCDDIVLSSHELPNPYALCARAPFSPGHVRCAKQNPSFRTICLVAGNHDNDSNCTGAELSGIIRARLRAAQVWSKKGNLRLRFSWM